MGRYHQGLKITAPYSVHVSQHESKNLLPIGSGGQSYSYSVTTVSYETSYFLKY
jgi:hypothetical protein